MKHHKKTQAKALSATTAHETAIQKAIAQIQQALASVPGLLTMTPQERKRTLKIRTGGERYVEQMAKLAKQKSDVCPADVDPDAMLNAVQVDTDLSLLENAITTGLQSVKDSRLHATGVAWQDALDVYALGNTRARRDPARHDDVAAMETFLATGPKETPTTPKA
jgi:hypothetical protein